MAEVVWRVDELAIQLHGEAKKVSNWSSWGELSAGTRRLWRKKARNVLKGVLA